MVEQLPLKEMVVGSNPTGRTERGQWRSSLRHCRERCVQHAVLGAPNDDSEETKAGVAKLVDATALGAVGSNPVEVQVLSPAQKMFAKRYSK